METHFFQKQMDDHKNNVVYHEYMMLQYWMYAYLHIDKYHYH